MQFVYPNLLYLLILLGLPILIHLFQLRRYSSLAFTNVAMLQKLKKQSRKSHSLLQWLLLILRLLIYTCIIFAFAQPYFPKQEKSSDEVAYLYYIDNYLSWDARNGSRNLLQQLKQEVQDLEAIGNNINWFSNTEVCYNQTSKKFSESIQAMQLSPIAKTSKEVLLQAEQFAKLNPELNYKLIWISDFHRLQEKDLESSLAIQVYPIQSSQTENTSIDTLYLDENRSKLTAGISHQGKNSETTLSLYSKDKLLGRQIIHLEDKKDLEVSFALPESYIPEGRMEIQDPHIQIDNTKYFSLLPSQPIKVYAIGKGENSFLNVFESEYFELEKQEENSKDFSGLSEANLLVLHNLDHLTTQLANLIENSVLAGNYLVVIPSETANLTSYNTLLSRLGVPEFTQKKTHRRRISSIHYEHPIFQGVFEREVENFRAAFVNEYYGLKEKSLPILSYDTGESFLTQVDRVFLFTASLSEQNTNMLKSALIVPIFYKMGMQSQPIKEIYQNIGQTVTYSIPGDFNTQDILSITSDTESFIPIQEHKQKGIWITTTNSPVQAGSYKITKQDQVLDWVSYNYPNLPKQMEYPEVSKWKTLEQAKSFPSASTLQSLEEDSSSIWKWFVIFALLFLGIEILLLKL